MHHCHRKVFVRPKIIAHCAFLKEAEFKLFFFKKSRRVFVFFWLISKLEAANNKVEEKAIWTFASRCPSPSSDKLFLF